MPFYNYINPKIADGHRTLERLEVLRKQLKSEIPVRTLNNTLLLAMWIELRINYTDEYLARKLEIPVED